MNRYIVAFISFHDNVLTQEPMNAMNEYSALEGLLLSKGMEPYDDLKSVEDLKDFAFDCECMISAYKIAE